MNKRRRILDAIKALPEVKRLTVVGDVLVDNESAVRLLVYFDDDVPEALGIQASEGIGTKERLG